MSAADSWLVWTPTPKQEEAIATLVSKKRFLLADVTGLGKTFSVLAAYARLKETCPDLHLMVFGTVSSSVSWKKDISKGTRFKFVEFGTHNPEYDELKSCIHDISIITYSAFMKFQNFIVNAFNSRPILLVLDEAHHVKNPKARTREVMVNLSPHSERFWMLTATPVTNHLEDLFWMVDLLVPGYFGDYWQFMKAYTVQKDKFLRILPGQKVGRSRIVYLRGAPHRKISEVVGYKNLDQLARVLEPILLRRDHELDIEFHRVQVAQTADEEGTYLTAAAGLLGGTFKQFSARMPDLQLVVNNVIGLDGETNDNSSKVSSKESRLFQILDEIFNNGEPVVIFTSSVPTLERLSGVINWTYDGKIRSLYTITGSTTKKQREKVSKVFGPRDVLLITQAGGESLNLQASGKIIFYDLPFDLKIFIQAVGRVARMDTGHEKIHVYLLESLNTIDTYKSYMIMSNAETFKAVLKGASTLPPSLRSISKENLKALRKDLLWRTKKLRTSQYD